MKRKLLRGYVGNRTKEIALATMFVALFYVARQFKITLMPMVNLDVASPLAYIPLTFLPWPYTGLFILTATISSSLPIRAFPVWLVGTQIIYFSSRLLNGRWKLLSFPLGSVCAHTVAAILMSLMGVAPFWVVYPIYLIRTGLFTVICFFLAPIIWHILRAFGILDWRFEDGS